MQDIDVLLGLELDTVELIIRPLHSVLTMGLLRVYHASFLDFLKDEARSSGFYIGSAEHKAKLGALILKALAYAYDDPQINLADLELCWYVEVHSHSELIIILQYLGDSHTHSQLGLTISLPFHLLPN
jgi:hypothetical protein